MISMAFISIQNTSVISSSLTISPIKDVLFYKDFFIQALFSLRFYFMFIEWTAGS